MYDTDALIIGSGIAGLSYALHLNAIRPDLRISIVTKDTLQFSSSSFAQGGIAAVTDFTNDSYENHIADTLKAGDGHCDPAVVAFVVREATERVAELSRWGVRFDKNKRGGLDLAREGGHSARRILHAADCTGSEIIQSLIRKTLATEKITVMEGCFVSDLIVKENVCAGAWVMRPGEKMITPFRARVTLVATGGLGQVFLHTTNPAVATGDGIAMAWRAGAEIADMEFIQFHPTALWRSTPGTSFLISEAVRGEGALLRNTSGERFMEKYDPRLELATRDVVARAVQTEMRRTGSEYVYLDCTGIARGKFKKHFPGILEHLHSNGLDPLREPIPVTPSAHYCCGGIVTDQYGQTSITNLYAAGESACTGLHGANRLASNSLLEALVFAHRAARRTSEKTDTIVLHDLSTGAISLPEIRVPDPAAQIRLLKEKMSAASIVIRNEPLQAAIGTTGRLRGIFLNNDRKKQSTAQQTYGNLLDAAWLIVNAWNNGTVNRGAFFRERETAMA